MKFVILLLPMIATLFLSVSHAADASCAHVAPHGLPQMQLTDSTIICRRGYVLQHDDLARIPAWVSYTLSREQTLACAPRPDRFEPDPVLRPHSRSNVTDYRGSGYDQGHMAPNADLSWDPQVQRESFYLSNIAPQLPGLNRGLWRELESIIRAWAYERGSLTIHVGPIYDRNSTRTIGANRVVIPDAFFKIVIDNRTGDHVSFVFPHTEQLPRDSAPFITTVAEVQRLTQITFILPNHATETSVMWTYRQREFTQHRNRACARP